MNLSLTHVVICDETVVGYVSILTDAMKLKILEDKETKDKIRSKLNISENNVIPAIKIGRFAIDKKYLYNGLANMFLEMSC